MLKLLDAVIRFFRIYGYSVSLSAAMVLGLYIATLPPSVAEVVQITWSWRLAGIYTVALSWVMLPVVAIFIILLKLVKGELYV